MSRDFDVYDVLDMLVDRANLHNEAEIIAAHDAIESARAHIVFGRIAEMAAVERPPEPKPGNPTFGRGYGA